MTNEELLKVIEEAKANEATELDLSNKGLTVLPSKIGQLTSLTHLKLGDNHLSELPSEIYQLPKLEKIDLWNNNLTNLHVEICNLPNLRELNLSGNQLTPMLPELAQLKNLTYINLSCNQLTELPSAICNLNNLKQLDLWGNQLAKLPQDISQLTMLRILNLGHNQLNILPPELFQLVGLTELNLSRNDLSTLPPELFQLSELIRLDLNDNRLSVLPPEISQFTYLEKLYLWDNHLSSLPPEIGQLKNLTALYLYNNHLKSLPIEIGQLTMLENLYIWGNQLTMLPAEICQLKHLAALKIYDNPLVSPPLEIAIKGIRTIRQYFAALDKGKHKHANKQRQLNEVKILLVGEGAAGKTSLTKALLHEPFNPIENVTHGISIRRWKTKNNSEQEIKVNIWDFGGQEIMHATHQFFLSKRSLYVLVLNARRDDKTEYWLRHIESFGGNSPVLIVLNKYDDNTTFDLNRPFLIQKYKNIKGFYHTSCKTGYGINRFREVLLNELVKVPMIATCWPDSWFQVKEQIEQLKRPYISCDEYKAICAEAGIAEDGSQETLVDFLHDLGAAVHFKDFSLDSTYVLDPRWVTNAVYKIVNSKQVADDKGVLSLKSLKIILKQKDGEQHTYPHETHLFIVELMKKFELCYKLDEERVLIPQLLGVMEPDPLPNDASWLKFVLHYHDFLPPSIMPRFIVKMHQDIMDDLVWRTGVVLKDQESEAEAVIQVDCEARRISIFVNGQQRKDYFAVILLYFREINIRFEKLKVSELVPMPDRPEIMANYTTLLNCVKQGIDKYLPDDSEKSYSVSELLGLVQFDAQESGQERIFDALERIEGRQIEDEKSFTEKAHNILDLKPNIFGITLNVNALFDTLSDLYKKWLEYQKKRAETHQ